MSERRRPLGGCACGATRDQVRAIPLFLYACHSTDCQRSAFSLGLSDPAPALHLDRGQAKAWRVVGAAGVPTRFWVCETCAGRSWGEGDGTERVSVRAGRLRRHRGWRQFRTPPCDGRSPANGSPAMAPFATLPSKTEILTGKGMARALAIGLSLGDRRQP